MLQLLLAELLGAAGGIGMLGGAGDIGRKEGPNANKAGVGGTLTAVGVGEELGCGALTNVPLGAGAVGAR